MGYENLARPAILRRIRDRRAAQFGEAHRRQRQIYRTLTSQVRGDLSQFFDERDRFIGMTRVRELGLGPLIRHFASKTCVRRCPEHGCRKEMEFELLRLEIFSPQTAADKLAGLLDMKRPVQPDLEQADVIRRVRQDYAIHVRIKEALRERYGFELPHEHILESIVAGFDDRLAEAVLKELNNPAHEIATDPDDPEGPEAPDDRAPESVEKPQVISGNLR